MKNVFYFTEKTIQTFGPAQCIRYNIQKQHDVPKAIRQIKGKYLIYWSMKATQIFVPKGKIMDSIDYKYCILAHS